MPIISHPTVSSVKTYIIAARQKKSKDTKDVSESKTKSSLKLKREHLKSFFVKAVPDGGKVTLLLRPQGELRHTTTTSHTKRIETNGHRENKTVSERSGRTEINWSEFGPAAKITIHKRFFGLKKSAEVELSFKGIESSHARETLSKCFANIAELAQRDKQVVQAKLGITSPI